MQQHVRGEASSPDYGFSSSASPVGEEREPAGTVTIAEGPATQKTELGESIEQGEVRPTPTVQQRRFSAPKVEWDPIQCVSN